MNVLVVRTSALGDVVHCLPVLEALRRGLPEAKIAWVVEDVFAPLLRGHPSLDAVIPVRLRAWRKGLFRSRHEIQGAVAAMRRFEPSVALDLMGNHKAGALARFSGAPRIVGPRRRDRREPSSAVWINDAVSLGTVHAVDRALEVVRALGVDPEPVDFGGDHVLPEVPPEAAAFLAERRRPYVLIQAGAGWGNKTYPPELWGEVARGLADATGLGVWVPTAPGEEGLARAVVESSGGAARAVDAAPFPFLAALVRRSRLVLGGDTGPVHLAHALGTPVVMVLGPTDPRRHGPWGAPDRVVVRPIACSFCYKRFAEAKACLLRIRPREIVDKSLEVLRSVAE